MFFPTYCPICNSKLMANNSSLFCPRDDYIIYTVAYYDNNHKVIFGFRERIKLSSKIIIKNYMDDNVFYYTIGDPNIFVEKFSDRINITPDNKKDVLQKCETLSMFK